MWGNPSGFRGAPFSKGVTWLTVASSLLYQLGRTRKGYVPPQVALYWKLFAFRHPGELMFGAILLYCFRMQERLQGSGKHASQVVVTAVLSLVLELLAGRCLGTAAAMGPYSIVFPLLVNFAMDGPPTAHFTFLSVPLTDKVFVYLLALQLMATQFPSSLIAAASGLLAGLAHWANLCKLRSVMLPQALLSACSSTLGMFLDSTPAARTRQMRSRQRDAASSVGGAVHDPIRASAVSDAPSAPPVAPDPQALEQLTNMGFSQRQAAQALASSGNDIQAALALLLG